MIRKPDCKEDYDFIVSYWLNSYFANSAMANQVPAFIYKKEHSALINVAVNTKLCLLYCDPLDRDHILGFICGEGGGILHYIYVKKSMRDGRIGKQLFKSLYEISPLELTITHQGSIKVFKGKIHFNPYIFWQIKT